VHHIFPDLNVIIMGDVIDSDVKELLANPSVRFIRKPLRQSELKQLLHETVGRRAPPDPCR